MHDQPLAIDLAETGGPSQPHIHLLAVLHRSGIVVEAVAERHVLASRDVQVTNLEVDRTLERVERLLKNLPVGLLALELKRGVRSKETMSGE